MIAKPLSEEELGKELYAKKRKDTIDLLEKVKKHLKEMSQDDLEKLCLDEVLDELGITSESYHEALGVSLRGQMVVLKRKVNEIWVNNYNPHFMKVWGANMDIQFCMDTYAVIT